MSPSNKIRSARYNLVNFFPISFLVQFKKLGNIFWVVQFLLGVSSPDIAVQDPWPLLIPLSIIFVMGMLKEFLSDYKRHKADRTVNETKYAGFVDLEQTSKETDPIKIVRKKSRSVKGKDGRNYEYYTSETRCEDF